MLEVRYAVTPGDKVLGECIAQAPWILFRYAVTGRWNAHCDHVDAALGLYGLGRN